MKALDGKMENGYTSKTFLKMKLRGKEYLPQFPCPFAMMTEA
jgi:hypothetical protein